jgi:hypothetical protein
VDYKFQPQKDTPTNSPDCLDNVAETDGEASEKQVRNPDGSIKYSWGPSIPGLPTTSVVFVSNCVLNLDDDGSFFSTKAGRDFMADKMRSPPAKSLILIAVNAHIKYSGGKIIPINELRFKGCSFDIKPASDLPTKTGQKLTKELLAASPSQGELQLPT